MNFNNKLLRLISKIINKKKTIFIYIYRLYIDIE